MKKRLLAMLLALCLCISLFPAVSAVDAPEGWEGQLVLTRKPTTLVNTSDNYKTDAMLLTVGVKNTGLLEGIGLRLFINTDKLQFARENGNAANGVSNGVFFNDVDERWMTELGKQEFTENGPWPKYSDLFEYTTTSVLNNTTGEFRLFLGCKPWNKEGDYYYQPENTIKFDVNSHFKKDEVVEFAGVRLILKGTTTWADITAEDIVITPDEKGGAFETGVSLKVTGNKDYDVVADVLHKQGKDAEGNDIGWFETSARGSAVFAVTCGTDPVQGAKVELFKNAGDTTPKYEGTTDQYGSVTLSAVPGTYARYKVTCNGYEDVDQTENIEITKDGTTNKAVSMTKVTVLYSVSVNVTDAENGNKPMEGATVTILKKSDSSQVGEPAETAAGRVTVADLAEGDYICKIEKTGYATVEKEFTIAGKNVTVTASMTKAAAQKFPVEIPVEDGAGAPLVDVDVDVLATSGVNNGKVIATAKSVIVSGGEGTRAADAGKAVVTFNLAAGTYTLNAHKNGYMGASGTLTVKGDGTYNTDLVLALKERTAEDGIGTYVIEGTLNEDKNEFTVTVSLKGIDGAETGFFGLDYNEKILTLKEDGFVKEEVIDDYAFRDELFEELNTTEGYHFFGWKLPLKDEAAGIAGDPLNTTENPALLATYTFTVDLSADGDLSKCIDSESFKFLDFSRTAFYEAYKDNRVLKDWWNDNGSDGEKHYQIAGDDGRSPSAMTFDYEGAQNAHVDFLVFEGEEDANGNVVPDQDDPRIIEGATVTIYDSTGENVIGTTVSDANGIASATLTPNLDYQYRVEHKTAPYWPAPGGYKTPDQKGGIAKTVITDTEDVTRGKTAEIKVGMLVKVQNDIVWNLTGANGKINGEVTGTDKGTLHVDYGFVVEPDAGYQLKEDTTPTYTVTDPETGDVMSDRSSNLMQDLPAVWDIAANKWTVPGDHITGKVTLSAQFETRTYTITGTAGANGNVTYDESTTNGDVGLVGSVVTHSGIKAGENSTTFKFLPANGYVIDRIAINGSMLPAEMTKGKTDYSYQFENVQEDANIVATYAKANPADPQNPTSEYGILTVNSGVSGKIDVTAGETSYTVAAGTQDVRILPLGTTVSAVVTADANVDYAKVVDGKLDFKIDTLSVNGISDENANGKASETVSMEITGDNNITATFIADAVKVPEAKPLQYHVVTKILSGDGTIIPIGDKLYDAGSTIAVQAYAATHWTVESFEVNGTAETLKAPGDDKNPTAYAYTIDDLSRAYTIYVEFKADSVLVSGFVQTVGAQNTNAESGGKQYLGTGASLAFIKTENGKEYRYEVTSADLTDSRLSQFTIELPLGTYTVEVHKNCYLPQTFSDLEITEADLGTTNHQYDVTKPIVLVAGNTDWVEEEAYIGDEDMRIMASAIRGTEKYQLNGDINEDNICAVEDMFHVKKNYAEEAAEVPTVWADFLSQFETATP